MFSQSYLQEKMDKNIIRFNVDFILKECKHS